MGIPVIDPRLMGSLPESAFPSKLTRLVRTLVTQPNGTRTEVYTASANPLYIDVPCRKTPFIIQRPTESEQTKPSEVTVSEFICMLKMYLPLFKNTDRVRILDLGSRVAHRRASDLTFYTAK